MARRQPDPPARLRPELLGLLHAVKSDPFDDGPRLVLADWLEEHGDPRGQHMRLGVERDRVLPELPRYHELGGQAGRLARSHKAAWAAPYRSLRAAVEIHGGLVRLMANLDDVLRASWADLEASGACE